jgi:Fic family protein
VTNPRPTITHEMLKLIAEIDEFKGEWRVFKGMSRDKLNRLRRTATIESVGSSTRIEGSELNDRQVEALLSRIEIKSFHNRDEEEAAGYAAAMDLVFDTWEHLRPIENHLKQLHSVLLQHSTKDERHRGEYKTLPNHVAGFDAQGREAGIVFQTTTPFDTPGEMEQLLSWIAEVEKDEPLHPLLVVGIFAVRFLAIHPFQDGNGRLSRILTTLLLLRYGYSYVPYSSLESIIEENKELYYKALRLTQQSLRGTAPNWEPWLIFFLRCLTRQKDALLRKMEAEQLHLEKLAPLAAQIVELFETRDSLALAQIVALTQANRNTAKARLTELTKRNLLTRHGKGRGVYYTRK